MNGLKALLACGLLVMAAGCSQSVSDKIDSLNEQLRAELPMTDAKRQEVQALRDEAQRLIEAGDSKAAEQAADKALGLLQRAKDGALMNKSDG